VHLALPDGEPGAQRYALPYEIGPSSTCSWPPPPKGLLRVVPTLASTCTYMWGYVCACRRFIPPTTLLNTTVYQQMLGEIDVAHIFPRGSVHVYVGVGLCSDELLYVA
jgi:hypothetical protein